MRNGGHKHEIGSEGTRGFVFGAVAAAIIIIVIMAFSGTGLFNTYDAELSGDVSDSVLPGDGG